MKKKKEESLSEKLPAEHPKETNLIEAYFKRYGVYFPKDVIKKVSGHITLTLREIYNTIRGDNSKGKNE